MDPKRVKVDDPGVTFTEEEAAKWFVFRQLGGGGEVIEIKPEMLQYIPLAKVEVAPENVFGARYGVYYNKGKPWPHLVKPVFTFDADF